jgi:hypothetical protein
MITETETVEMSQESCSTEERSGRSVIQPWKATIAAIPLREIEDVGRAMDDVEAHGDGREDRADGDPADDDDQDLAEHGGRFPFAAGAGRAAPQCAIALQRGRSCIGRTD